MQPYSHTTHAWLRRCCHCVIVPLCHILSASRPTEPRRRKHAAGRRMVCDRPLSIYTLHTTHTLNHRACSALLHAMYNIILCASALWSDLPSLFVRSLRSDNDNKGPHCGRGTFDSYPPARDFSGYYMQAFKTVAQRASPAATMCALQYCTVQYCTVLYDCCQTNQMHTRFERHTTCTTPDLP